MYLIEPGRRKPLIDLCKTCWAERHSAFQHFYQCYKFIVIALEVIGLGLHKNELSNNFKDGTWDMDSRSRATSLLHSVTDFEFIAVFLRAYQYLSHLAGITVKRQSGYCRSLHTNWWSKAVLQRDQRECGYGVPQGVHTGWKNGSSCRCGVSQTKKLCSAEAKAKHWQQNDRRVVPN